MGRIGSNPNISSDSLEARMLPNVEGQKLESEDDEQGGYVDYQGSGQYKMYMAPWQKKVRNFGSRSTKVLAGRGTGKSAFLSFNMADVTIGLPRMMGGFCGASAKQNYTRTMPNVLKIMNLLGFTEGVYYFLGRPPAKLRWPTPLAKPRVWENCVSFANGFVWQMISLAVKGSANGLNLAALMGDETKYMPWQRVKEEVLPTLRGDFMPPDARKVEQQRWGYGTNPKVNNHWLSQLWVSDAGLNARECLWEKEAEFETHDVNDKIKEKMAELRYLERYHPKQAQRLAQNDNFLRELYALRTQSESFWRFSSIENAALLGGEAWIRQMKRELPDLLFRLQILGQPRGSAKDGFYCNFSELNTYVSDEIEDVVFDKYSTRIKGRALDGQRWPTDYESETLDWEQMLHDGEDCSLDLDLDYSEPLRIALDANADINCFVVGQTRIHQGRTAVMVMKEFFVQGEIRLRGLSKLFAQYYKPFLRRGCKEVIFYVASSVRQGANKAYALEESEQSRFDIVVADELTNYGFKVTRAEFTSWRHERKYQYINDCFSFVESPAVYINRESGRCDYLRAALENTAVVPGTFRKYKDTEKLKSEEGIGGDKRQRTTITDAFDDLLIGIKECAEGRTKIGGALRGRYSNVSFDVLC
ncbi:MAG: hypothetical protein IKQ37_01710 [Bacteroidaceae bacterium]|nr:hypothetical protein [Bacteroidaceae bacterium]